LSEAPYWLHLNSQKVKFELRDPNLVFQGNIFILFRSNPNFLDDLGMGFYHGTSVVVLDAWGGGVNYNERGALVLNGLRIRGTSLNTSFLPT
jgi:hypothetical protein